MRAHAIILIGVLGGTAAADPKPEKVDVKPFRDTLVVLQDGAGKTYVIKPHKEATDTTPFVSARIFYGIAGKELYEQVFIGRSADGPSWQINTYAPRVPGFRGAVLQFKDGAYIAWCGHGGEGLPLTQLTGEKAKAVLDKSTFMTEYNARRAHLLARDDSGVYYYVDKLTLRLGGKGFRIFVGRKGAMKQLDLVDIASDSAGQVFSTKNGDLRLAFTEEAQKNAAVWIRGEKRTQLVTLDTDINSQVIWSDLGIYKFLGTLCDNF